MSKSASFRSKLGADFVEVICNTRKSILGGAFNAFPTCTDWKTPPFKLVPFISSTFTDTALERDFLQDLLFEMREIAKKHGMF